MRKLCYILLIFMVAIGLTQAQESPFNLIGNGARAAAMGGAFTALADDATSISWNPAGLPQLQYMEASVVGRFGFGSASYDFPDDFGIDTWDVETQSNFQFNFASFVVPFDIGNRQIVAGVAYRTVYDFNSYQKETIEPTNSWFFDEFIQDNTGSINAISPSVGVPISDNFSVGATANIMSGTFESETEVDGFVDPDDDFAVDYSGFSVDLGVLFKASDQFSAGASLTLPHTITWESDIFEPFFSEVEMDVPLFFAVGAAVKPSDVVTFVADYRSRPWSNTEWVIGGETVDSEDFIMFENANSFHFGIEYLAESGDSFIPLRVGYNTVPLLFTDDNDDSITGHNITAGLGIILEKIILDVAFEYTMISYLDFASLSGDIDFNQSSFRFTVGGVLHLN
jgi:long-subunit fatty acid transport protein